jgi:hypothetical protein
VPEVHRTALGRPCLLSGSGKGGTFPRVNRTVYKVDHLPPGVNAGNE